MNYYEWSQDYLNSADEVARVINKLKKQYRHVSKSERKLLDAKLSEYRRCYRDCLQIAKLLRERHEGAA